MTSERPDFMRIDPWGPAYVWARALIALSTLCTLLFNSEQTLFHARTDVLEPPVCGPPVGHLSAFCQGAPALMRWLGIAVMLGVLSGYRPRWLALPHAWIAWSVSYSISLPEGGDQIAANLAILLIPLAWLDPRRSLWQGCVEHGRVDGSLTVQRTLGLTTIALMRLQGLVIYLDAAISKFAVSEWSDGTATYYWMRDPLFSPGDLRGELALWVTDSRLGAALTTWGTLALELALAAAMIGSPRYRRVLLVLGLGFHASIALAFGLVTFGMAVAGLLCVYLGYDRRVTVVSSPARVPRAEATLNDVTAAAS